MAHLQFGRQQPLRFFPQNPGGPLTPEQEQGIRDLVDIGVRNGHIPPEQAQEAINSLRSLAFAALGGDEAAMAALNRQEATYSQPAPAPEPTGGVGLLGQVGEFLGGLFGGGGEPEAPPVTPTPTGGFGGGGQERRGVSIIDPITEEAHPESFVLPGAFGGDPTRVIQRGGATGALTNEVAALDDEIETVTVRIGALPPASSETRTALETYLRQLTNRRQQLFLGDGGGGQAFSGRAANLLSAFQRGDITEEQYQQGLQDALGLGLLGGGGLTEFQSAQLDLSRQRLGLEREQSAIQAARAGNPLAYLSLTTGQTPQEALETVPVAPFQAAIRRGEPLGRPFLSGPSGAPAGSLRTPGAQAQARMSPVERASFQERVAVESGVSPGEQQFFWDRLRSGLRPVGRTAGFGGQR